MKTVLVWFILGMATTELMAGRQEPLDENVQLPLPRILDQDPKLNNLVDPDGYATCPLGALGNVRKLGSGTRPMILIPGLGFGGDVLVEFVRPYLDDYRIYLITLPGFAGTAAPPCPPENTSFGEQTWTLGCQAAIEKLIHDEKIEHAIVVGHWLTGTQLALRLAIHHPEVIEKVVILSGSARMMSTDPRMAPHLESLERRIAAVDKFLAPQWFKTVTRETWDDNNFLPGDYAVHPVRGLRLWREAARPPLHVWVRYLCEFQAQDSCLDLDRLSTPTLLLIPGFEGNYHDPGNDYMQLFCHQSWDGFWENHPQITRQIIPNSRICMWLDQPELVHDAIASFLQGGR